MRTENLFRILLVCISVAFIIVGVYRGEAAEILEKAINVCLECIGIG